MHEISLDSPFPGKIFYIKTTGSTMDLARRLTESADPPLQGTVVAAGEQTEGRGRMESRKWDSSPDRNLLFTLLLRRDSLKIPLTVFPLAAGLAVARALEGEGVETRIKWPNDILAGGRKICGILCETAGDYLSTGIGLNCRQTEFPGELGGRAVSLVLLNSRTAEPLPILEKILREFAVLLGDSGWREEITARLAGLNREAVLLEGTAEHFRPVRGIIRGIGLQGELLFETSDGELKSVFAGEIEYGSGT